MKVMIVGSGGREFALGLALAQDERVKRIFFAPGNGMSETIGQNIALKTNEEIVDFCVKNGVDLVIVGPEDPLIRGLVDDLKKAGIRAFGPTKAAAMLEGSKAFMKDFVAEMGIPTARFLNTNNLESACEFIETLTPPIVVKADGLCAGKGVVIAKSHAEAKKTAKEMLSGESFGKAGEVIVIEEFLDGYELSVFGICDGESCVLLPAAQDHKRLKDGDIGPNTGGMGAYAPTPLCDEALLERIKKEIFLPTLKGMKERASPFCGVLFAGIMVVNHEPFLLEFNVRFGDPECEVLMPLLETPLLDLVSGQIPKEIKMRQKVCVGVVAASKDYPYKSSEPAEIFIDTAKLESLKDIGHIVYAGVSKIEGKLYATGGRVLLGVGLGESVKTAKENAYKILNCVKFDGIQYRKDIAYRALN